MPKNKGKVSSEFFSLFFLFCDKETPRLAYPNFSYPRCAMVSTLAATSAVEVRFCGKESEKFGVG